MLLFLSMTSPTEIIPNFRNAVAALPRSYGIDDRPNLNTCKTAFSETIGEYEATEPTGLSERQTIRAMGLATQIHKARTDDDLFATIKESVTDFLDAVDKILNLRTKLIDDKVSKQDPYLERLLNISGPVLAFVAQLHHSLLFANKVVEDDFIKTVSTLKTKIKQLGDNNRLFPYDSKIV